MVHAPVLDSIPMTRDPQRDRDISTWCGFIESAGKAGLRGLNCHKCGKRMKFLRELAPEQQEEVLRYCESRADRRDRVPAVRAKTDRIRRLCLLRHSREGDRVSAVPDALRLAAVRIEPVHVSPTTDRQTHSPALRRSKHGRNLILGPDGGMQHRRDPRGDYSCSRICAASSAVG